MAQWGTVQAHNSDRSDTNYCFTPKRGVHHECSNIYLDPFKSWDKKKFPDNRSVLCIFVANSKEVNYQGNYVLITEPRHGEEDTFVRIGLAILPRHKLFNVTEAVERQGAVMESQRNDDKPQRTIQYLV